MCIRDRIITFFSFWGESWSSFRLNLVICVDRHKLMTMIITFPSLRGKLNLVICVGRHNLINTIITFPSLRGNLKFFKIKFSKGGITQEQYSYIAKFLRTWNPFWLNSIKERTQERRSILQRSHWLNLIKRKDISRKSSYLTRIPSWLNLIKKEDSRKTSLFG